MPVPCLRVRDAQASTVMRVAVRVRFAPSPTGSLHVGNALTAVANRRFADEHGGVLVLRIDDTDPLRTVEGGEDAILEDLAWLGLAFDEGPVRQSERGALYEEAARHALASGGAVRDEDGSVRLAAGGTTLLRPEGTATYQLASVVDDLELGITHVIRGSDHRPNLPVQTRIASALGSRLPIVIHHGLVLGPDGKKLSKRHGHSSIAELRDEGLPAEAVRAYLEELGLPEHDVQLDLARLRRLAIDAIAAMTDEELAAAAGAPLETVPVLRGARSLVEAREYARLVLEPGSSKLPEGADATLERFDELRTDAGDRLSADEARSIVRELKAVGGDLRALRLALTGAPRGPELAAVLQALGRDEALERVSRAAAP
jgi:glutamyl-tRNA synthetase